MTTTSNGIAAGEALYRSRHPESSNDHVADDNSPQTTAAPDGRIDMAQGFRGGQRGGGTLEGGAALFTERHPEPADGQ